MNLSISILEAICYVKKKSKLILNKNSKSYVINKYFENFESGVVLYRRLANATHSSRCGIESHHTRQ